MFKLLSKYIQDQSQSRKFLDVLLPMLAKRSKESGESIFYFGLDIVQLLPADVIFYCFSFQVSLLIVCKSFEKLYQFWEIRALQKLLMLSLHFLFLLNWTCG